MRLKIAGGRVYDPACGWQGEERDLYVLDGRLVSRLTAVDRVLEARGQAVLPAGIELRGQVATCGLNFLRLRGLLPSPRQLGENYARLGYTHLHEPFLTLATAAYVHRELAALPVVDTSASLVLNLRDLDLWLNAPTRLPEVAETLLYLLTRTRSLNLRVVEPYVRYRQDFYRHRVLSTEKTLEVLPRLAQVGNFTMTLEASPELLQAGLPEPGLFHLAALGPALESEALLDLALANLEAGATADLGLVSHPLAAPQERLPVSLDLGGYRPLELCPVVAAETARRALALALRYQGPRLAFSGAAAALAPAAAYPELFSWLWDAGSRPETWAAERGLRQYSLSEWVWATRTLPARLLGLADRGTLAPGGRADVALYDFPSQAPPGRWRHYLGRCRTLLKAGEVVVENFSLVQPQVPRATWYRETLAEAGPLVAEICQYRSFRPENLGVPPELEISWVASKTEISALI